MRAKLRILSTFLLLVSCSNASTSFIHKYEYSDIQDKMINYLDVFKQTEEKYYLYYFQLECYHCHGIKSKVISYALKNVTPFYFVQIDEDYGFLSHSKEETIGTNDPLKSFALMTPQLSLVECGYIIETYLGDKEILNVIES